MMRYILETVVHFMVATMLVGTLLVSIPETSMVGAGLFLLSYAIFLTITLW